MKIAVFHELHEGGARRAVNEFATRLNKNHTVDLYISGSRCLSDERHAFSSVYAFNLPQRVWQKGDWRAKLYKDTIEYINLYILHKAIAAKINKKKYDVVFIHPSRFTQAPFILRFLKSPAIYYCQEPLRIVYDKAVNSLAELSGLRMVYEYINRHFRKIIDKSNIEKADIVLANSRYSRTSIKKAYGIDAKISYLGVDHAFFKPDNTIKDIDILYIGAQEKLEMYDLLEKALDKLNKKFIVYRHLQGKKWISDEELRNLYRRAKLIVCLHKNEPFGLLPIEANSCGVPAIALNNGGYKDTIIDGVTGYLVPEEPRILADRIESLLMNPKKLKKMSKKSRENVLKKWKWDDRVFDLENIFKKFIKSKYVNVNQNSSIFFNIINKFKLKYLAYFSVFVSLFINTYRLDSLMLLIGDAGRDYLAARDMIVFHKIPLVGIPSSVPWLHQGPISIYGIGLSFIFSNFNPIAPGIFFGIIGAVTTYLVYLLGKKYFNENVGTIACLLYSSSPIVVVNARMPYHTSLIPFFATLFFLIFYKSTENKRFLPLSFLFFGLMLQVELSNIIVLLIMAIVLYINKVSASIKTFIQSFGMFIIGSLPFVLYEFYNGPTYIKFPLWIINRTRLFIFGEITTVSDKNPLFNVLGIIYQHIGGTISPSHAYFGIFIFVISLVLLLYSLKNRRLKLPEILILLWIGIPFLAYFIHSTPGSAYFALVYPAIILSIAVLFSKLLAINKLLIILPVLLFISNFISLLGNDFYVTNSNTLQKMPPTGYSFGTTWKFASLTSQAIVDNANGRTFSVKADGIFKMYKTSLDPYIFLIWKYNGHISKNASLIYRISNINDYIDKKANIIYTNTTDRVIKYGE